MATTPLDRLLYAQGGKCFFCERQLITGEASIEHLLAKARGGGNDEENCVACCKSLNSLLGHRSLKEKLRVILNQKGAFLCPGARSTATRATKLRSHFPSKSDIGEKFSIVVADLKKRGTARPGTVNKLGSTINALFNKNLSEAEITTLIDALKAQQLIAISGTRVAYTFSIVDD